MKELTTGDLKYTISNILGIPIEEVPTPEELVKATRRVNEMLQEEFLVTLMEDLGSKEPRDFLIHLGKAVMGTYEMKKLMVISILEGIEETMGYLRDASPETDTVPTIDVATTVTSIVKDSKSPWIW